MRLLEREECLAALVEQWQLADASGRLVVVDGEAGAGKSTLVRAFLEDDNVDAPILWGACDPLTTPRPLGPVHDMVEAFDHHTRSLLLGDGAAHEIFSAVFGRLQGERAVVVVEDVHWSDQGTIDLLRFLLRRLRSTRSLIIATLRNDEIGAAHPVRPLLGDVARSPEARCITLDPLSMEAVTQMVEGRPIDPAWLHEVTGGNPFFVRELLDHEGDDLPVTVRDAVLARASGLDPEARTLLDLLACAPEGLPDQLLPTLGVGIQPLRALDEAGLIDRGRSTIRFVHDLCRLAVAGTLPPGGDVALHRRLLDALESSGTGDAAVLAHHAVAVGEPEEVRRHCTAAGRRAARSGAHTQAAELFQTALEHCSEADVREQAELLELLSHECYLLDRLPEALSNCERALRLRERLGDSAAVSADHEALSLYEWYNANRALAEQHASQAAAVPPTESTTNRLAHARATEAYLALQATDLAAANALAVEARRLAADVDDPALDVRLRIIDGACALLAGDDATDGRSAILAILAEGADQFDEIYSSGYSNLAYLDVEQRRLREAGEVLEVSIPLTIERDVPICHVWQMGARARRSLLQGEWELATADAEAVLSAPSAPLARTWPHLVRALVALRSGEDADGDLDHAWELAHQLREPLRLLPVAAAFVERAWLCGGDDRVDDAERLLRELDGAGLEWSRGDLALWLDRIGRDVGSVSGRVAPPHQLQLSRAHLEASEAWAKLDCPYEQALALVDSQEVDAVRRGVDLLDRLGADAVAAKVRRLLREQGHVSIPGRRRASTVANAAGLTARQVEVLELMDRGMTNAEIAESLFISVKTADHHVSAILSKLQVSNRRAAAAAGRRLGLLG